MILAGNGPGTQTGCTVQPGSAIRGQVVQLEPGDAQHLPFAVTLLPA